MKHKKTTNKHICTIFDSVGVAWECVTCKKPSCTRCIENTEKVVQCKDIKKKKINKVCSECGISANVLTCIKKYKQRPNKLCYTLSTSSYGACDFCGRTEDADGEPLSITSVRDYFYPDFSLLPPIR